jgi:hypothetical protein
VTAAGIDPAADLPAGLWDVLRDTGRRRSELLADIRAVAGVPVGATADPDPALGDAVQTRPAILRRLAALLAQELPPAIDRLLGSADRAAPLVTALALHTGLPFALVGDGNVRGELYPGERVAVVDLVRDARTAQLVERMTGAGAEVAAVLTAVCNGPTGVELNRPGETGAGLVEGGLVEVGRNEERR